MHAPAAVRTYAHGLSAKRSDRPDGTRIPSSQLALLRFELLEVLDQSLLAYLMLVRRVEVLLLHGIQFLLSDLRDIFLSGLDVDRQLLLRLLLRLGLSCCLVGLVSLLVGLLLGLLQLVPILLQLRKLLADLLRRKGGRLVEGQRGLRLLLLRPPLLELAQLLGCTLDLACVHPSHVRLDEPFGLVHVLNGLADGLREATAGLHLDGPLLHGAEEVLQALQLLIVLGLAVS